MNKHWNATVCYNNTTEFKFISHNKLILIITKHLLEGWKQNLRNVDGQHKWLLS